MAHEKDNKQDLAELSKVIREHLNGLQSGPGSMAGRLAAHEVPLLVALSEMVLKLAEKHGN